MFNILSNELMRKVTYTMSSTITTPTKEAKNSPTNKPYMSLLRTLSSPLTIFVPNLNEPTSYVGVGMLNSKKL